MGRHILDKTRARDDGGRATAFAKIEREIADAEADPKVQAMHRARPAAKGGTRTKVYQKIDKQRSG